MSDIMFMLQGLLVTYGLNVLGAIIIFLVGRWAARLASRLLHQTLTKAKLDRTLVKFTSNLVYVGILLFAVIGAFERLGVETTTVVALVGASGLAIGLALQGSLSNFASGVLILLFLPFEVGDLIEGGGAFGTVEAIHIFNTIILTPDNKTVIVTNSKMMGDNIVNYSKKEMLRLDMVFGIGYDDDLLKAKRILQEMVMADKRVLKNPAPKVAVLELADRSVNFAVRPYVKVEDYWGVHFDLMEAVKLRFDKEGISIPYLQQDIHLSRPNAQGSHQIERR